MLGIFFRETLDMFNPEEVAPEVRLSFGDGQPPRQNHQRADAHRQPAVSQHFTPAFTRNDPWQHSNHRHRQREEAFGHHPHPAGHAQQDVAEDFTAVALSLRRTPEAAHCQRQPHGNHRVEHRIGADTVDQQRGQEYHCRQNRQAFIAENTPCQPGHQQGGDGNGEHHPKADGKIIMTE